MLKRVSAGLSAAARAVAGIVPVLLLDGVGLAAVGAIAYGAWQIYAPAGWITGGVLALAGVLAITARR